MRRTVISNLQWWLFLILNGITWAIVPHLRSFAWWGLILFGAAYYTAFIAIFRMDWESGYQAAQRRADARQARYYRKFVRNEQRRKQAARDAWLRER